MVRVEQLPRQLCWRCRFGKASPRKLHCCLPAVRYRRNKQHPGRLARHHRQNCCVPDGLIAKEVNCLREEWKDDVQGWSVCESSVLTGHNFRKSHLVRPCTFPPALLLADPKPDLIGSLGPEPHAKCAPRVKTRFGLAVLQPQQGNRIAPATFLCLGCKRFVHRLRPTFGHHTEEPSAPGLKGLIGDFYVKQ
jgi:hypothetical protein